MAMTKKEQAMLETARTQAALRWTAEVLPDIPCPKHDETTYGYKVTSGLVRHMWSRSGAHGTMPVPADVWRAERGSVRLHSTRSGALRAWRHTVEREAADRLRHIDRMIEEAELLEASEAASLPGR